MILAYHRINPWHKNDALTVSPESFRGQIDYLLKKKFKPVSLPSYFETQNLLKTFTVTFDDGFADNYRFALPVLKKNNIPVTIFLSVHYIGTENLLQRYKDKEKDRFLNWSEVKEMAKEGVEFGSHCLTHSHLTEISEEEAWKEIHNSKKILEDKLGKEVSSFCYPYGDYNEKIIEMVEKAGYKGAVITGKRKVKRGSFTMPRVGIYGHNNFFIYKVKIWRERLRKN